MVFLLSMLPPSSAAVFVYVVRLWAFLRQPIYTEALTGTDPVADFP